MSRLRGKAKRLSSLVYSDGRIDKYSALRRFLSIDCESCNIGVNEAHYFFDKMLYMNPPPPESWFCKLMGALVKSEHFSVSISCYKRLCTSGIIEKGSNFIILNMLINCFCSMKLGSAGFSAFGLILKNGYPPDIFTFNSLIKGLCLEEKLVEAVGLVPKMYQLGCPPDIVTYTTLIKGLCKTKNFDTALKLHREMVHGKVVAAEKGCMPRTISYSLIDGGCIEWPMVDAQGKEAIISPDLISYSCLITGLCRSGLNDDAISLFAEMLDRGVQPDMVAYNILINLLCKKGKVEEAEKVLDMAILKWKHSNNTTYNNIVDSYCRVGKIESALRFYKYMISRGIPARRITVNTLLKGLLDWKKVGDAMCLLKNMKKMDASGVCCPDKSTYAVMINGLRKQGQVGQAEELLLEMKESGLCLEEKLLEAFGLVPKMCKTGNVATALQLHREMVDAKESCKRSTNSYSLVDGGCIEWPMVDAKGKDARISPNVVSYNCLIDGLGLTQDAMSLFAEMMDRGVRTDTVTYSTVINLLCKKGKVEEAMGVLEMMILKGKLPGTITYTTIVDGYCRIGKI